MKLLVLCVDGLDYDYAAKLGYPKMPHEAKLSIPAELCIPYHDVDYPHTLKIWPSILAGEPVDTELEPMPKGISKPRRNIREFLHSKGIKWNRGSKKKSFDIYPANYGLKTIVDNYNSIMWNIPTINPEFIWDYPTTQQGIDYMQREYEIWKILTHGMLSYNYQLSIAYFRILDMYGHLKLVERYEHIYLDLHSHVRSLQNKGSAIMLISDHATSPVDGDHHNYAYLGCTVPVEATSVLELRGDMERIMEIHP